ncbi:Integrator complex subunit 7 [Smittium mucronatum]|uniref:Integrator complex subunit 7 n=1 Tax=Smittium mucronatum TaxID=133383 RepID=A0A1R0H5G5_9FUNG|nr:Integrator complex subunit 7 [Smittium mucronatum]
MYDNRKVNLDSNAFSLAPTEFLKQSDRNDAPRSFQLPGTVLSNAPEPQNSQSKFVISEKVASKIIKLESGCRNKRMDVQIESISGFIKLLNDFPFPVVSNSIFLKLADLFCFG